MQQPRFPRLVRFLAVHLFVGAILSAGSGAAQVGDTAVPKPLEAWVPWVLDDADDARCPLINDSRLCVWTTRLALDAGASGASFALTIATDNKGLVELPGSAERWPEEVRVDGQARPVLSCSDVPCVDLTVGNHSVTGRFVWKSVPDSLKVPADLGQLSLRLNGASVPFPKREANGLVWLENNKGQASDEERLELSVHRRIDDGIPMTLITRVRVAAGGKAREVVLPNVLVAGTRPVELKADIPAQLTPEGRLRIQAQAGDYQVEIRALVVDPVSDFKVPANNAPWPEAETWVFKPDDRLRHVELSGAAQIDPQRTDLAADWKGSPTYTMTPESILHLETRRRGEPEPPPNQIRLRRQLWLDLDGNGYTVRDTLAGTMNRDFRINLSQGQLGHAVVDGKEQVITTHDKSSGVEVRRGEFTMDTEWRLEQGRDALAAVGYSEDMHELRTELNLPPGYKLLGASGVDNPTLSWIEGWDLFAFFFVLLVSLAAGKLAGKAWFPVALLALILTHDMSEAPTIAWVFLLVAAALVRVVGNGRGSQYVRWGFIAATVGTLLVMVPFAVTHVRRALYPQLEESYGESPFSLSQRAAVAPEPAPAPQPMQDEGEADRSEAAPEEEMARDEDSSPRAPLPQATGGGALKSAADGIGYSLGSGYGPGADKGRSAGKRAPRRMQNEVDPNQVVQTGPGIPTWRFHQYELSWSGPVEHAHTIQLWIASPTLTRLWSLLAVLLSAALLYGILRAARASASFNPPPTVATAALATLGLWLGLGTSAIQAQEFPNKELLDELRTRLLEPAECEPECLAVSTLRIKADGTRLVLSAQVHAGSQAAYQAPGPLENWAPESVRLDGKEAPAATRLADGFLYVRVPQGLHEVELAGPMPKSQSLTLTLGSAPHRVEADAKGYELEGLDEDGQAEGSISLRRELNTDDAGNDLNTTQAVEPWLMVRREFDLGVRFQVHTVVERLSATGKSILIRFPLLPGESVTESGLTSDKGTVVLELGADAQSLAFESVLAKSAEIKLQAAQPSPQDKGPVTRPWSETWVVRPSMLYHVDFEGIAPISRKSHGNFEPVYQPWPGETLVIKATKLPAAEGTTVTNDRATLTLNPGTRMEQSSVVFRLRSSQGTTERILLPPDAVLASCKVDGQLRSARLKDAVLEVQLDPGEHEVALELQRAVGIESAYSSPRIKLNRPLTNVTVNAAIPSERWLLWTAGPSWGPAVLFWGYLLVVLLGAFALSRVPFSPLKPYEWVLLGLGLTQVDVVVVFVVLAWLFCLAYRERNVPASALAFNLTQVFLAFLTVVALCCLAYAVHQGLVVRPDMQVMGSPYGDGELNWYTDHTAGAFPEVRIWSLPMWIYRGLMLLWALWLAASLLRWLKWGWSAFRTGGGFRGDGLKPVFHRGAPAAEPPAAPAAPSAQPLNVQVTPGQNPRVPLDQIEQAQAELDRARRTRGEGEDGEDA